MLAFMVYMCVLIYIYVYVYVCVLWPAGRGTPDCEGLEYYDER